MSKRVPFTIYLSIPSAKDEVLYNTLDFIKEVVKLVQTEDALNTQLPCCYSAQKCFVKPHLCSLSELSFGFSIVKQKEMKLNVRVTVATFIFIFFLLFYQLHLQSYPAGYLTPLAINQHIDPILFNNKSTLPYC